MAAGKAQKQAGGGAAQQVAGPSVVKFRSGPALRAPIGGRKFPGAHAENSGGKIPERDPAGQEVPPGPRILDAGGACAFGGIQEGLTVRSDAGKTNGPEGDSGDGEGFPVPLPV